jgi:hypothetical protein
MKDLSNFDWGWMNTFTEETVYDIHLKEYFLHNLDHKLFLQ